MHTIRVCTNGPPTHDSSTSKPSTSTTSTNSSVPSHVDVNTSLDMPINKTAARDSMTRGSLSDFMKERRAPSWVKKRGNDDSTSQDSSPSSAIVSGGTPWSQSNGRVYNSRGKGGTFGGKGPTTFDRNKRTNRRRNDDGGRAPKVSEEVLAFTTDLDDIAAMMKQG